MRTIDELPINIIEKWSQDPDPEVRREAMEALRKKDINDMTDSLIEKGLNDTYKRVIESALYASRGHNISLDIIEQFLSLYHDNSHTSDNFLAIAATGACINRILPLDRLEKWLSYAENNRAFHNAIVQNLITTNYEIPLEIINNWLNSEVLVKQEAAIYYLKTRNKPIPKIRTIEPPDKVYKACLGKVIVVAHIPEDAEIRGKKDGKCRTNKATIVDIIGEFGGEKVGISFYDGLTCYNIGDEIEIKDFDHSFIECGAGFHFFCSLEKAKEYGGIL